MTPSSTAAAATSPCRSRFTEDNAPVGIITRIGSAPGVRRLVRRSPAPGEVRVSPDDEDVSPAWCADCRREVLFGLSHCGDCGGPALSAEELARRTGGVPPSKRTGPASW